MKDQVYKDSRDKSVGIPLHEYARTHLPGWPYWLYRIVMVPLLLTAFRVRVYGRYNVPPTGGAILAPNHMSNADHFFCVALLRRMVRFVAKSQLFKGPLGQLLLKGGCVPVFRGQHDLMYEETCLKLLEEGQLVTIYAEGGRSRSGEIESAKIGIGYLSLKSGKPVVPVAIIGTVHMRNGGWRRFPRVTVLYGRPLQFRQNLSPTKRQAQAVANKILDEVRDLYTQGVKVFDR
ncbi:MAG TPA: lysophospholipid acyltransferase family protein [Desulfobacter sp.]|nr:lysophospholipid acyltransferase family protein [Desulfobacter sp.]